MSTATSTARAVDEPMPGEPTHREILEVLSGLLLALFVSNISGTVVSNALPTISKELGATAQQYTWFVTASLLASTATTPIWGKLADMFNKKTLLMAGIGVFIIGSAASGAAPNTGALIGARVIQGVGLGAMMALVQAIIGTIIPPRQRGRYMAYTGATMAIATVIGPLVGGFIVDQSWLGWRWCFWSAIPFSLLSIVVLQWRLHVPVFKRAGARVDWLGAALITAAVSDLLIWISFSGDMSQAGHLFPYASWQTAAMLGGALVLIVAFVIVERHVSEPIVSMKILTARTTALAVIASIAVGTGMFGASVFLGQYYQIGRGYSPTEAGLMTVPMMLGVMISSVFVGRLVSKVGRWKPFVQIGSIVLAGGFLLLSTIDHATQLWLIGIYMTIAGLGIGMTMQNLVLAVQNSIRREDVGTASATVTFFRSLGGAFGVQLLGSVFAKHVADLSAERLAPVLTKAGINPSSVKGSSSSMDLTKLPAGVADIIRSSYGDSIGRVFLIAAALSVISVIAIAFMKGTELRGSWQTPKQQIAARLEDSDIDDAGDDPASPTQRSAAADAAAQATADDEEDAAAQATADDEERAPDSTYVSAGNRERGERSGS